MYPDPFPFQPAGEPDDLNTLPTIAVGRYAVMTLDAKSHLPNGMMVIPILRAASVIVFAPTFMPYDAQTTTRSAGPNPCDTKLRVYFSAYRFQSSHVRKKLLGVPLVPLVSWMVKTFSQPAERNWKSGVFGGWCSRMVRPETMGSAAGPRGPGYRPGRSRSF